MINNCKNYFKYSNLERIKQRYFRTINLNILYKYDNPSLLNTYIINVFKKFYFINSNLN